MEGRFSCGFGDMWCGSSHGLLGLGCFVLGLLLVGRLEEGFEAVDAVSVTEAAGHLWSVDDGVGGLLTEGHAEVGDERADAVHPVGAAEGVEAGDDRRGDGGRKLRHPL